MTDPAAIDLDTTNLQRHEAIESMEAWSDNTSDLIAEVEALRARVAELKTERDLAIAHDQQPYPTASAYEAVCKARFIWQARTNAAEAQVVELARALAHLLEFADSTGQGCAKQVEEARNALAATPTGALERAMAIRGYFTVIQRKVREHPPSALISQTVDTLATEALDLLDALDRPAKKDALEEDGPYGKAAYRAGVGDNPHPMGFFLEHMAWNSGWSAAQALTAKAAE